MLESYVHKGWGDWTLWDITMTNHCMASLKIIYFTYSCIFLFDFCLYRFSRCILERERGVDLNIYSTVYIHIQKVRTQILSTYEVLTLNATVTIPNTMIRKYDSYIDNSNNEINIHAIIDICKEHVFSYILVNLPESLVNFWTTRGKYVLVCIVILCFITP